MSLRSNSPHLWLTNEADPQTACRRTGNSATGAGRAHSVMLNFAPGPLLSVTRTALELSIVCPSGSVPSDVVCQAGWWAFTVEGKLEFSAVGILASILNPLAEADINILSISTFDTDYVLVPATLLQKARAVLRQKFELLE